MIVGYLRLSLEDDELKGEFSDSIENQKILINSYASLNNLVIDEFYIDDGKSGINYDRCAFIKMKEEIEKGHIEVVITKDISRLGRDFLDTSFYINEFFKIYGVRYIAINDCIDTKQDEFYNQTLINIRNVVNDSYVKDVSRKRKQVADLKSNNHEFIGPYAPYGYLICYENKKRSLKIDDKVSNIVKQIFNDFSSGVSRKEIASMLNLKGVVPPSVYAGQVRSDSKWNDNIILRILNNKTYCGHLVIRKSFKHDYKQKKRISIPKNQQESIPHVFPSLVSEDLFNRCQKLIKRYSPKKVYSYNNCLNKKIVFCKECGNLMSLYHKKGAFYFTCRNFSGKCFFVNKIYGVISDYFANILYDDVFKSRIVRKVAKSIDRFCHNKLVDNNKMLIIIDDNLKTLYLERTKKNITQSEFSKAKEKLDLKRQSIMNEINFIRSVDLSIDNMNLHYQTFVAKNINKLFNYIYRIEIDKLRLIHIFL